MMKFLRTQMKWIMALIVVAFLLSTFLMYEGRSTRRSPGPRNADGTMEDYEVAIINGRSLMRSELEQRFRNYLNNYSTRSAISLDVAAIYQTVLDQAILESQMAKEVKEQGITVSDAEADRQMKLYADTYFPTREAFYQVLSNSGLTQEAYKKSLASQMANDRLMRNAVGEIIVSEDNAVAFYDTMKNMIYTEPEGFMINVANFNSSQAAEDMRARISSGQSWLSLASGDVFASKDVINITKEPVFLPSTALHSGFLSVLDSLDVGQVSPVFSPLSGDFAVAVKTEHVDSKLKPYSEVSGDIKSMLRNQEERRRLNDYQAELMNKAQVVINDKSLFERPAVSEDKQPEVETESQNLVVEEIKEVSSDSEPVNAQEVPELKPEPVSESKDAEVEIAIEEVTESNDNANPEPVAEVEVIEAVESGEPEVEIEITEIIPESGEPEQLAETEVTVTEVKEPAPKPESAEVKPEAEAKSEDFKPVPVEIEELSSGDK